VMNARAMAFVMLLQLQQGCRGSGAVLSKSCADWLEDWMRRAKAEYICMNSLWHME
jgi:hypothetical protein